MVGHLTADFSNRVSATYGQRPPSISDLTRFALPLICRYSGHRSRFLWISPQIQPLQKLKNRSCRRVVISRTFDMEMEFYLKPVSEERTRCIKPTAKPPHRSVEGKVRPSFRAEFCTDIKRPDVCQQIAPCNCESRPTAKREIRQSTDNPFRKPSLICEAEGFNPDHRTGTGPPR